MSQIDKLVFLPELFWFLLFLLFLYFLIFSYVLPLFFSSLKVRSLIFNFFIKTVIDFSSFVIFCLNFSQKFKFYSKILKLYDFYCFFIFYKNCFIIFV